MFIEGKACKRRKGCAARTSSHPLDLFIVSRQRRQHSLAWECDRVKGERVKIGQRRTELGPATEAFVDLLLSHFSWRKDHAPKMASRAAGGSRRDRMVERGHAE